MQELTPKQIVALLDQYIVGQTDAKRAVAVALRNRHRRERLPLALQDEIMPKNILMIGPTGVGKTEIARRLARLVGAPFVKVEATKYTEVGYVGRDVESMVRELVETAVRMVRTERSEAVRPEAERAAAERLLDCLCPLPKQQAATKNPLEMFFGSGVASESQADDAEFADELQRANERRRQVQAALERGELENTLLEIEVEDAATPLVEVHSGAGVEEMGINFQDLLGGLLPKRKRKRKTTVAEARKVLIQEEAGKLIDLDAVSSEAVHRAETKGIIFIDEIDKIAGGGRTHGPDVSREGVQRDILPIVEGCTVVTKYGPVKTDHVLFIAAGAFHVSRPSDLIPELQGRFPIRVELEPLSEDDFKRILTEPQNAVVKQYQALLSADGVEITFTPCGISAIARMAARVNEQTENIGARRLHTVLEKVLEGLSFDAPDPTIGRINIDEAYVEQRLAGIVSDQDVSRFIL